MTASSQHLQDQKVFSNLREYGSKEFIEFLEQCAALLPEVLRFRLRSAIHALPREGDNLERILELVRKQWQGLRSDESVRIALVGPDRTGKSTLVEEIVGDLGSAARDVFTIVDTQGLEEFLGYRKTEKIPSEVSEADVLLLVLDSRYRFTEDTLRMVETFSALEKTFFVVLNKIDLVESPRQTLRRAKQALGVDVLSACAFNPNSLYRLLKAIVAANSKALYPLSRGLPKFRASICEGIVSQAAFGAGLVSVIPTQIADTFAISAIQVAMVLRVARVFGFRISRERARELLPLLAGGLLVREGTHRLGKRFPEHKGLIEVSMSSAWTYLAGRAAVLYFQQISEGWNQLPPEDDLNTEGVN
jgi:GTP-binding protein Era